MEDCELVAESLLLTQKLFPLDMEFANSDVSMGPPQGHIDSNVLLRSTGIVVATIIHTEEEGYLLPT